jgi:hypothetical protein
MIGEKDCQGFLYQTERRGKRARHLRDRERVSARGRMLQTEEDSVSNKIDR